MKITKEQLKQIIREEIQKTTLNEVKTDVQKRLENLLKRVDKLKNQLGKTSSPAKKADVQGRLARALQRLSNLRKDLTAKK
jgi:hypothetical protein